MLKTVLTLGLLSQAIAGIAHAQQPQLVTPENFTRAESDLFNGNVVRDVGLGVLQHRRGVMGIDDQFVVRGNRDTLYSVAVFDLDAGPVTITLPDAGERFMSLQIIDQDQYVPNVFYDAGTYQLTREAIGTRYVGIAIRILIDPNDAQDVTTANQLQDLVQVDQPGGPGVWEVPQWDQASQNKVRDALLSLAETLPDTRRAFGTKDQVDPVRRLIQSAAAWGGNPDEDALYLSYTPSENDGKAVYQLKMEDVPVDGFWSISVYNAKGYYEKNPKDLYNLNSMTAQKSDDGTTIVQFGACEEGIANCLPTMAGWNYMVRLYRAHPEVLSGEWIFPEPVLVAQ